VDANVKNISYNDNGRLINVSDYIRSHPKTFHDPLSIDFMSQVMITYDNGIVICVNRHPSREWKTLLGTSGSKGWFDYNSTLGLDAGYFQNSHTFILPAHNGWVCYIPSSLMK
jgi:hypothetical protein